MFAPGRAACRSQAPLAGSATKLRIGRLSKRFRLPTLDFKGDALMATKQITDSSFESDVLEADGPLLADFWAEWCGPCKMIGPSLAEISDEMGENVTIAKLNINDNTDAAGSYGVRGIPTLNLFMSRRPAATKAG